MTPGAPDSDRLSGGHYARKQIFSRSRLVAWSHGSRFDMARALVAPYAGGRLLDYGCGDGTFIAMIHAAFAESRGVDSDAGQIAGCNERLGDLPGVRFTHTTALAPGDMGVWSAVTCMETLEHCLEDERRAIIARLGQLCAPGGRIIISVPIETGPSLVGKQTFRALAGLRRVGDYQYRERYTFAEMVRGVFGRRVSRVAHGVESPGVTPFYGHKGFEWRDVEREAAERLIIESRTFSPLPWAGASLNSQVWLVCRPR